MIAHFFFAILGVRYFIRGVDDDGHVANYIETEQMMTYCDYHASFVQVMTKIAVLLSVCACICAC